MQTEEVCIEQRIPPIVANHSPCHTCVEGEIEGLVVDAKVAREAKSTEHHDEAGEHPELQSTGVCVSGRFTLSGVVHELRRVAA